MAILVKRLPRENSLNISMWAVNPLITQEKTNALSGDARIAARVAISSLEEFRDNESSLDQIIIAVVVATWDSVATRRDNFDLKMVRLSDAKRLGSFLAAIEEAREDVFRVVRLMALEQKRDWSLNKEIAEFWED